MEKKKFFIACNTIKNNLKECATIDAMIIVTLTAWGRRAVIRRNGLIISRGPIALKFVKNFWHSFYSDELDSLLIFRYKFSWKVRQIKNKNLQK